MKLSAPQRVSDGRAEAAEQELAAFNFAVSHDLSASFRQVDGFLQLLLSEFTVDLTDRQRSLAKQLSAATTRCQLMLQQLVAVSRMEQTPLKLEQQDATLVMKLALMRLAEEVSACGALVTIEPLGEAYADRNQLALVFHHLLDNAIKFNRPGVLQRVVIKAANCGKTWSLTVADNGIGVASNYRDKAFGMFRRLNAEEAYPGIGGGLALCRRIAHRHGGELMFVDCAEGACIELSLPCAPTLQPVQSLAEVNLE